MQGKKKLQSDKMNMIATKIEQNDHWKRMKDRLMKIIQRIKRTTFFTT